MAEYTLIRHSLPVILRSMPNYAIQQPVPPHLREFPLVASLYPGRVRMLLPYAIWEVSAEIPRSAATCDSTDLQACIGLQMHASCRHGLSVEEELHAGLTRRLQPHRLLTST
jgi:hypothetical protein